MGWRAALRLAATLLAVLAPWPVAAQMPSTGFPLGQSPPILTLDQDRLFEASAFGQRVLSDLEAAARALAAENRALEEELIAEERALTERRPELTPEEFRELADAFDERVVETRRRQESKNRALSEYRDAEGQRFFTLAAPVLTALVMESGAVALLDSRVIFLAADQIDITEAAIQRVDAEIGSGAEGAPDALPFELPSDMPAPPPASAPDGGPPLELTDPSTPE